MKRYEALVRMVEATPPRDRARNALIGILTLTIPATIMSGGVVLKWLL